MILTFYSCLITFILLTIFAIGAISFSENLLDFIDKHWEEIRESAKTYTMNDFKAHVSSELVSLGAFALTIDLSLFIRDVLADDGIKLLHFKLVRVQTLVLGGDVEVTGSGR